MNDGIKKKKNVISFMNMKGGVGKTTLCVNLADCLAQYLGLRVLIVDMDPQFNATQYLLKHEYYLDELFPYEKTIKSIFKTKEIDSNVLNGVVLNEEEKIEGHIEKVRENLYLICGDLRMIYLSDRSPKLENRLKKYINNEGIRDNFDFIFIDCPPTYSIYTIAAFNASDYYILPVKPDFLSVLGINLFQQTLSNLNDDDHKLECLGMVFTLVQDYPYIRTKMADLKERYPFYAFSKFMKQSTEVLNNAEKNICLYNTSFKSDIMELTDEFVQRYQNETGVKIIKNE